MSSKSAVVDEGKSNESSSANGCSPYSRRGLVAKVESYFYENDDFAQLFENFANEHASVIDLQADKTEFKLEYTDVYNKFLALFESSLSRFIEDQGGTIEDFYEEVREVSLSAFCIHCEFWSWSNITHYTRYSNSAEDMALLNDF